MKTAKLSGDKLNDKMFCEMYQKYLVLEGKIVALIEQSTPDKDFKAKIYRQLTSVASIMRKEYHKKSIEHQS